MMMKEWLQNFNYVFARTIHLKKTQEMLKLLHSGEMEVIFLTIIVNVLVYSVMRQCEREVEEKQIFKNAIICLAFY